MASVQDVCDLSGLLQNEDRQREDLEKQVHRLKLALQQQEGRLTREQTLSKQIAQGHGRLHAELKNISDSLECLNEQLSCMIGEELRSEWHARVESEIDEYIDKRNDLVMKSASMLQELQTVSAQLVSTTTEIDVVSSSNVSKKSALQSIEEELHGMEVLCASLKVELEQCSDKYTAVTAELAERVAANSILRLQLTAIDEEMIVIAARKERITAEIDTALQTFRTNENEMRAAIVAVKSEQQAMSSKCVALEALLKDMAHERSGVAAQLNTIAAETEAEATQLADCKAQQDQVQAEFKELFIQKVSMVVLSLLTTPDSSKVFRRDC
jgi:chromosome segregation ATPase